MGPCQVAPLRNHTFDRPGIKKVDLGQGEELMAWRRGRGRLEGERGLLGSLGKRRKGEGR